jgi:hypothetical protein
MEQRGTRQQNHKKKEHPGNFINSKLFPETQQKMQQSKLLMLPDNRYYLEV